MKAIISMMFILNACGYNEKDNCLQVAPTVTKHSEVENFKAFRIYFFSFANPGLLNNVLAQRNGESLNGSIFNFGSPDYKSKFYNIIKDSSTINTEIKISLMDKCYTLKLDPSIRNYLMHLESVDSIRCFGNNDEFIAIE